MLPKRGSLEDVYKRQGPELPVDKILELPVVETIIEDNLVRGAIDILDVRFGSLWTSITPVSYTHLDVYKRQGLAVASTVALAACGAGGNKSAKDDKTLTVGIMTLDDTTEPLWDKVKELAKDKGVTIELKEFTDYNLSLIHI